MFESRPLSVLSKSILAIDAGPEKSGFALYHKLEGLICGGKVNNIEIRNCEYYFDTILIEYPDSVQPNVGNEFIKMVWEAGRFHQHFSNKNVVHFLGRKEVKKKVKCKDDKEVRKFLINNYGEAFDKKLSKDAWQAMLLIHCYLNHE